MKSIGRLEKKVFSIILIIYIYIYIYSIVYYEAEEDNKLNHTVIEYSVYTTDLPCH